MSEMQQELMSVLSESEGRPGRARNSQPKLHALELLNEKIVHPQFATIAQHHRFVRRGQSQLSQARSGHRQNPKKTKPRRRTDHTEEGGRLYLIVYATPSVNSLRCHHGPGDA